MKRFFSGDSTENSPLIYKLSKVKDAIFSKFLHIQEPPLSTQQQQQQQQSINNSDDVDVDVDYSMNSSFNTSQTPITARQLQAYYNSLKLQNEELSQNLEKTTQALKPESPNLSDNKSFKKNDSNWNNAESTNIELDKENQPENRNTVILLNENKNKSKNNSDLDLDLNSSLNDNIEELGLPPIYSQPDPLERANLVQLKKMMELEKYRRYRLNYIREHTRNVNHSSIYKVSKNIQKNKNIKPKFVDIKKLPKDRQNTSGIFGISLLDTIEDKDIDVPVLDTMVKPLDNDITKKIKFNNSKSPSATFTIPSKPKSFNIDDLKKENEIKQEVKSTNDKSISNISDSTSKTPIFNMEKFIPKQGIDDKPSTAFNFNPQPIENPVSIKPSTSTSSPAFSLSTLSQSTKKEDTKPIVNFGFNPPETKKVSIENVTDNDGLKNNTSLNSKSNLSSSATTSSIPSFGLNKTSSSTTIPTMGTKLPLLFESKSENTPNNSNDKTPAINISNPNVETNKLNGSSNGFKFGQAVSNDSIKLPALNFGASSNMEKSNLKSDTPSINSSSDKKSLEDKSQNKQEEKPSSFSFGLDSKQTVPGLSSTTPSTSTPPTNSNIPKLSFNNATLNNTTDNKTKSVFGTFGTTDKPKPVTFGGLSESNINEFSFDKGFSSSKSDDVTNKNSTNISNEGTKKEPAKVSSFNFGGFGNSTVNGKIDTSKPEEPKKSEFNFTNNASTLTSSTAAPATTNNTTTTTTTITTDSKKDQPVTSAFGSLGTDSGLNKSTTEPKFNFGMNTTAADLMKPTDQSSSNTTPLFNMKKDNNINSSTPNSTAIFSGFGNNPSSSTSTSTLDKTNITSNLPKIEGLPKIGEVKNTISVGSGFNFGGNTNINNNNNSNTSTKNTRSFDSMNESTEPSAKRVMGDIPKNPSFGVNGNVSKNTFGGFSNNNNQSNMGSTGFNFGTSGSNNNTNAISNNSNNGSSGAFGSSFSSQPSNNQPAPGKIFSFGNSNLPALGQNSFNIGNKTNNNNNSISNGFGFGNSNSNNNNGNSGQSAFGGMMNNNNNNINNGNGNMFGVNNNNGMNNINGMNSNSAFGSGFNSGNSSRSNTPSFNFTGQATTADPSAIFQAPPQNNNPQGMNMNMNVNMGMGMGMGMSGQPQQQQQQQQQTTMSRRRAFPRSMRGGARR